MNATVEQVRLFDDEVAEAVLESYWCIGYEPCRYMAKSPTDLAGEKCPECGVGEMELVPF